MILYFDKYGTLVKRENEGETWVQGDDQSYSLKTKFYDDTQANITEDTPFINLSNYVVNCVVEREDKSKTPTLTMNRFDANTGAKVLVDNWWTEINGNITVTIRLVDIVDNSVKATGLATITINKGNVPSDTTITNSEKAALEEAIALKEDKVNKTTSVRTEEQASDVLYPSEKAVAKVKSVLTALVNQIKTNLENELQVVKDNVSNNAADIADSNVNINLLQIKVESIGRDIVNLSSKDSDLQNQIDSLVREIGTLVIGADFVPKTRTIAEISLENDITKQELVEAIISLFGSAAQVNTGYTANTIPVIGNDGKLPKSIMPISDGLIPGGTIERGKSDTEAIITPSDDFLAKYPDEVQGVDITITTETTKYSSVYFVVKNASNVTILGQENCEVGDWIIAQGVNGFDKIDNVDAVKSVNGMLGNVEIKPKDLILEDYATSELDDNNIYPTDSTQTGLAKLDKRIKELETKSSEAHPNVFLEIADLNNPTASEKAVIIETLKSITNNFTTEPDWSKYNEIILMNRKGVEDIRYYSLLNYEFKNDEPIYYQLFFNIENNIEYIIKIGADYNFTIIKNEYAKKSELFSKNYNDLTNKPTIPTVPTKVSSFTNDSGYVTQAELDSKIGDINTILESLVTLPEPVYKKIYLAKTVADNYTGMGDYRVAKYPQDFNNISPDFAQNRISYIDLPTDGTMTEIEMEVGYVYILTDDGYDEYVKAVYVNGSATYPSGTYDESWKVWPYEGSYTSYGEVLMKVDGTINPKYTENGEHTIYMTYD